MPSVISNRSQLFLSQSLPVLGSANASTQTQTVQHSGPRILQKPAEVTELRCLYKTSRTTSQCKAVPSDSEKSISIYNNLSELLMAMQDELDQMTM